MQQRRQRWWHSGGPEPLDQSQVNGDESPQQLQDETQEQAEQVDAKQRALALGQLVEPVEQAVQRQVVHALHHLRSKVDVKLGRQAGPASSHHRQREPGQLQHVSSIASLNRVYYVISSIVISISPSRPIPHSTPLHFVLVQYHYKTLSIEHILAFELIRN